MPAPLGWVLATALALPVSTSTPTPEHPSGLLHEHAPEEPAPPVTSDDPDEARLARAPDLATVLGLVVARNPELSELGRRAAAARARTSAAGRLPDLELAYAVEGVPLSEPWALDMAEQHMLGLRQMIPAPGTRSAREKSASEEWQMTLETVRAKQTELVYEARRAYADYYRTDREYRAHMEHAELSKSVIELARSSYRAGRSAVSDVLRVTLELSRLHRSLLELDRERASARGFLNTLMRRPPDAPLGPAVALDTAVDVPSLAALEAELDGRRPEIRQAARAVTRSEATLSGAQLGAKWPSFMVGAEYMWMPMSHEVNHGWGAMVSINLPWLSDRRDDEIREAEETLAADKKALEAAATTSRFQLYDALRRHKAAKASLELLEKELLPQASESFEATRASFSVGAVGAIGVLDALRTYLEIRIEEIRSRAALVTAVADVERAAGLITPVASEGEQR
jgi:cobalt-zinc-cadmium efflux system outer membrane protein